MKNSDTHTETTMKTNETHTTAKGLLIVALNVAMFVGMALLLKVVTGL